MIASRALSVSHCTENMSLPQNILPLYAGSFLLFYYTRLGDIGTAWHSFTTLGDTLKLRELQIIKGPQTSSDECLSL